MYTQAAAAATIGTNSFKLFVWHDIERGVKPRMKQQKNARAVNKKY
jgi:hypothetical protein